MSKYISLEDALSTIKDGMTIMVGGFLANGSPNTIIDALARRNVKDLTVICNDSGFPDKGIGQLLNNRQVKKLIVSYIGATPLASEQMNAGELVVEFNPQGTLAERVRCGGCGLGGFLTPTGLGTVVADGKQIITVDGKQYLLETPLHADVALIGASMGDELGNLRYEGTSRNFNTVMAMAADTVIAEIDRMVPVGDIAPEDVHTPAILINHILKK